MPEQAALAFTGTISARFAAYCEAHPEVEQHLVRLAREARAAGFTRYGAKALVERVRWHFSVERGDGEFKIDNCFTAPYARLLMSKYPDLAGMFETRRAERSAA